jgi:hypothetical protein
MTIFKNCYRLDQGSIILKVFRLVRQELSPFPGKLAPAI